MLANPVKAQDSWTGGREEGRDGVRGLETHQGVGVLSWQQWGSIAKHECHLVSFVLQQNCSGWDMESDLEEKEQENVLARNGSGLN